MKLTDFLEFVSPEQVLTLKAPLVVGVTTNFNVVLVGEVAMTEWPPEFWEWLKALDLEVESITAIRKSASYDHKPLISILCEPIKIRK